ncbi:MAG: diguanylate cyclase [Firmicutes bacterium]|nr:diguanylate cyclase [Bacillota bacterium]
MATYSIILGPARVPSPSIADVFSIAYVPIILGIMFSLGKIRRPFDTEKKRFLADVTMTALAVFLLNYEFVITPAWYSHVDKASIEKISTVAYPMLDWVVLISLFLVTRRFRENQVEGWIVLLTIAIASSVVADIAVYVIGYQMNPVTISALVVTALAVVASAIDEATGFLIGIIDRTASRIDANSDMRLLAQNPRRSLIVPIITSLVISIVWFSSLYRPHNGEIVQIIISMIVVLLIIYRDYLVNSDNAILFAKALRDSLTGLNNHRYFQESLNKIFRKAERSNKAVSLLFLDIDNFSHFNNTFGHILGDRVLITIGSAIHNKIRETDEACRLSGDEFAIILPETSGPEALITAGNIRAEIDRVLGRMFPDKDISVTIGISTYPNLAKNKDELVQTTDGALYWAKLHGKNQILLYDPEIVETLSAEERARRVEEAAMLDMVQSLAKAVDARDPYTRLHSKRVSDLATKLAKHIGLDEKTVNRIAIAGILHDVGKIGVPDNILNKPGRLTKDEMTIVKNHPLMSAQIIRSTSLKDIIPAVKAHHERWDGAGYPQGLKGERIPIEARILAIADAYDAMTTDRPYRKGLTDIEALNEIARCAGTQFDPYLAAQFLEMPQFKEVTAAIKELEETVEGLDKASGM